MAEKGQKGERHGRKQGGWRIANHENEPDQVPGKRPRRSADRPRRPKKEKSKPRRTKPGK